MEKTYNKLVRDLIPQIIEESGKSCCVSVLSDSEYLQKLDEKLSEELLEYYSEHSLEELADLLEVLYASAIAHGYTIEELEKTRLQKRSARGGFEEKKLLISVRS